METGVLERIVERIRAGKAALVVGASFGATAGFPPWREALAKLNVALGRTDATAAVFTRALGTAAVEAALGEAWRVPAELPEAARILGRIPVRAIWSTHPGDLVEKAVTAGSPAGWPEPKIVTAGAITALDARRRHVLHLLHDEGGLLLTPEAVRKAYAPASRARAALESLYHDGTLVFIGFRSGDPDLELLTERMFAGLEPPGAGADHFYSGALGPDERAELFAEHRVRAFPDQGFLEALAAACDAAGLTLSRGRPAADDLEGWSARLHEDAGDAEARDALLGIEQRARAAGRPERLVEVLLVRVEHEHGHAGRAAALRDLARTYEVDVGDLPRAFTALTTAMKEDPTDEANVAEAERLAAETDGWGELVADLSEIVPHIQDKRIAAGYWVRLGRWYQEKLRHDDYAIASYREALKLDPARVEARSGLADLYRRQQRWGELAEEQSAAAALEADHGARATLLRSLAELYENALSSPGRAIETYERLAASDGTDEEALNALERLYRRAEDWGKLAAVLERRAHLVEKVDPQRALALRKELAQLRAEKLGDIEGAIARMRAALEASPRDLEALRSLVQLYERTGRSEDHLAALERLAEAGPESERAQVYRRLAAEVEDREGGAPRAIRYYERVLALEPAAPDALRSLERLYRAEHAWDALTALVERRIAQAAMPAQRAELWQSLGRLHELELADPHRALEAYVHAADLAPESREVHAALARLYKRIEAWDRAVATLERQAELVGAPGAADLWFESAQLLSQKLGEDDSAETRLGRALEADPGHVPTLTAFIDRARRRGDYARAVTFMLDAERATGNRLDRVALLHEAGVLSEERLAQADQAVELFGRVLLLDPDHVDAGRRLADRHVAAQDWIQAEPVLEMLVRKAEDRMELARRHTQLGDTAAALQRLDKAARHYALAMESDPDALPAALGLAEVHVARHEHQLAGDALRGVLEKHRPALAQGQVIDIWYKLGLGARALGDREGAGQAFARALELDPGHRLSLREIVELAVERGDWKAAVTAKRDALEGAAEDERIRLYEEIGDLTAKRLEDPVAALGVYLEALKLRPRSHVLLHKVLEIYTDAGEWRRAVEILDRLAEIERDPVVRAKLHYTAALIARDELDEPEEAVTRMGRALDDAPTMANAFEAVEEILSSRHDWKGLVRAYTQMIKRLGDKATFASQLYLWTRLGDVASEKLSDPKAAIAAYEVASALEPANIGRHEQLAELYLAAGPDHVEKAAIELQLLLRRFPDRLEVYHKLFTLYSRSGQRDKAFCLAQALTLLGHAGEAERALIESLRPRKLLTARRRLTEELWQKSILHPREDRIMNGIFGLLMSSLAATTAQTHGALGLSPKEQAGADDPHAMARVFRYVVQVLGIQPAPELYLKGGRGEGIQAANVAEKGVLTPAVLIHSRDERAEGDAAFEVGKKLAWFRPERYVYYALPTVPKLEAAFAAALCASGVLPPVKEPDVEKLVTHVKKTVPASVLEHVAALARKHPVASGEAIAPAVGGWITATDLTANRVGLILANDLETAARQVATEKNASTSLPAKERLRDLLAFASSEEYFAVRRHLGLEVGA